jgi:hypothetical protein
MPNLKLEWNKKEAKVWAERTGFEAALKRALTKSGNDALKAMRAEAKRQVRETKRIKAGYLAAKAFPLTFPRGKQRIDTLVWRMGVSGKAIPLSEFPRAQRKTGVRVEVNRGEPKIIESAFLAKTKDGRKGVFLRPTKARYPMGHKLGPSVADSVHKLAPAILKRTQEQFRKRFEHWLPTEMAKTKE